MNDSFSSVTSLTDEKRALVKLLLKKKGIRFTNEIIPLRLSSDNAPLSFAQQRLWFLDQLEGPSATYNVPAAVRITGNLNYEAIEQALVEIVLRHEVLRTHFLLVDDTPVQAIAPAATLNMSVVDLQESPEAEQSDVVLSRLATEEAKLPFDLKRAPLMRVKLVRSKNTQVLLVTMHHIVSDGWSLGIFIKEFSTLYQAFVLGESNPLPPLPELPIQYADFAVWQRQWLSGEVLETKLNYWKQKLAGATTFLELPTDRLRPPVQSFRGTRSSFKLKKDLTEKLNVLSQKTGSTLFMTLLATLAILLYRYSGQEDILIGTPSANRNRKEIEPLIGFFVNTLVLRTCIEGNPSFIELLKQVQQVTLEAYEHQDVPFEQVVEALQPTRNMSHSPLFQVMFSLQNAPMGELELPGLTITPLELETGIAKFDLSLSMEEKPQGMLGIWEYNSDLFEPETIARMSGHFQNLLAAIVTNPLQPIDQLPLLRETERQQLLREWNHTQIDYSVPQCIHKLFEIQVEQTPDAVAVVFENQQLTYRELNCRANQLARHLQSLGVKPDVLVGICVERSLEMVVGLLGILKAGGAYVPLDPAHPQERLAFMLSDSQVAVLLYGRENPSLTENFSLVLPDRKANVVCLDKDWGKISQHSEENLVSSVEAENLAYVIYTSGSTGIPKGVLISHGAIWNHCRAVQKEYELNPCDRVLQFASLNFDASAEQIFPTLIVGSRLVLRDSDVWTPTEFYKKIADLGLTVVNLPTAYWQQVATRLETSEVDRDNKLRLIIVGGDLMSSVGLNQRKQSQKSPVRLLNAYGPTEATITTTVFEIPSNVDSDTNFKRIPIGRPLANKTVYILDRHLQPVPIGVKGELYIGGTGVARGYLNHPELTQEKFIPDVFSTEPDARLYKTGDLVRYLPDGNIDFLGRVDNQVKIRGFRIELGEIETVLSRLPVVREAVVIVREDQPGDKRLVAYVVSQQQVDTTLGELRRSIKEKLPDYMMPSAFVFLDALPRTPSDKIDRRALPAPDIELSPRDRFVLPNTPTEQAIANTIAEVLGIERVGIHDNFFELGGHSLKATQVVSRLRQIFRIELPVRCLFESPTVAELDRSIWVQRQTGLGSIAPAIEPVPRDFLVLPLSYAQARLWFLEQLEGLSAAYNMPAAVQITGNLNVDALKQTLTEIVRRHEVLHTSFKVLNGTPVQVIDPMGDITLPVVDLQGFPESAQVREVQQLAMLEAQIPFDLQRAPLVRSRLLRLGQQSHVLLLTLHHIVSDGWSFGILIQELSALYTAISAGQPSPLTPMSIQYADFAIWQRQWLTGKAYEAQLAYWQQQLADAPPLLELPTDRVRPPIQTFQGSHLDSTLNPELTEKLKILSQKSGVTLFMTLLAAFAILLYRYSGQNDILIGTPIASRNRQEIESLIGLFVNTLVLRTRIEGNPSFNELLKQVSLMALDAYTHQDVPFEQCVEVLQPQRNLSYSPLFQVMFILQNAPIGEIQLPGLTITPLEIETEIAKFDLTLSVEETPRGLVGTWEYNSDLFDAETIARMSGHFQNLLAAIVTNPCESIAQLPLLSETERQQLLVKWNDTTAEYPADKCIHQLFSQQVQQTPDAIAVVFEDTSLTYSQLNARADRLAHYLLFLGVESGVLVGICVDRSLEMVVGLLGILKAGGAYVPIDPDYPIERISHMLQDSQISVLLTQQKLKLDLGIHKIHTVYLDSDSEAITHQVNAQNLRNACTASQLAYAIYTSGSTGKPKAVQIQHSSVVNFLTSIKERLGFNSQDTLLSVTTISFDIAALEIFLPLICGAKLVVVSPVQAARDGSQLLKALNTSQATVMQATPVTWQLLLAAEWQGSDRLQMLCGGEALPKKLAIELLDKGAVLWNMYGPTETTIWSSMYRVASKESSVYIGRPLANTQFYILDSHLQPVPVGVFGELHIGGEGLAKGYLNRSELTAEKFISNPFSDDTNSRLYKTGDLVRYKADGNIEFFGRIDNQVKINGLRIELGEIEAGLTAHPQIQQACVIVREDNPGNKRLAAYIVLKEGLLTSNDLRSFLKRTLPEYMVPHVFVFLDALPLTPNGKVDRRALPLLELELERPIGLDCPSTPMEESLAAIWSKILGLEQVGIHDNFFDLGGDSIASLQIVAQANQAGIQVTPKQIFQHQTIAELATVAGTDKIQVEQGLVTGEIPQAKKAEKFTPTDFSSAELSQAELDDLLDSLDE